MESKTPRSTARRHADEVGLALLREEAKKRGGEILSTNYIGMAGRYRCRCAAGHEWDALGLAITQGRWCKLCHYENRKVGHEQLLRARIKNRGGTLLAEKYEGALHPVRIRCALGHEWVSTPNRVQRGSWCPDCLRMIRRLAAR